MRNKWTITQHGNLYEVANDKRGGEIFADHDPATAIRGWLNELEDEIDILTARYSALVDAASAFVDTCWYNNDDTPAVNYGYDPDALDALRRALSAESEGA